MTTTTIDHPQRWSPSATLMGPSAWLWAVILTVLVVLTHLVFLRRMFLIATDGFRGLDADWGHIVVIPLLSLYFVYLRREQLMRLAPQVAWIGLLVMMVGQAIYALGIYPVRNDMVQGFGMVVSIFGMVWFLLGGKMMQYLWFPIAYLLFMIKISDRLWDQIAFRLQIVAADFSTIMLTLFSAFIDFIPTNRGSTIDLTFVRDGIVVTESLNVAEACAGLRALMAFIALGVAVTFIGDRAWWQRIIMLLMTIPIAVAVNVGRVTTLGLLYLIDPSYSQGEFHVFIGMMMLIPGLLAFLALGWLLEKIVIRPEETSKPKPDQQIASTMPAGSIKALFHTHWSMFGLLAGGGLTFLVGLTYLAFLASYRPEMIAAWMPAWVVFFAMLLLIASGIALFYFIIKHAPAVSAISINERYAFAIALVAGVLVVSWLGQSTVIGMTRTVLIKQPVPLRHPVYAVPHEMGSWVMLEELPPLSDDMVAELGTQDYFTRRYKDTNWPENEPGAVAEVHIAYYTGIVDTVPHVPDRCFIAGGVRPQGIRVYPIALDATNYVADDENGGFIYPGQVESRSRVPTLDFSATVFTYGTGDSRWGNSEEHTHNVVYFFVANGGFFPTPDIVRVQAFDPRDRYLYYCKIEIRWPFLEDRELAAERSSELLSVLLPEVMGCLPDWVEVQKGEYPRQNTQQGEVGVN